MEHYTALVWPLPAPFQSPSREIFPKSFTQLSYACSQAAVWALQLCGHLYCNIGTGEHLSVSGGTTEKTTSKANINPVDIYNLVRGFSPSNINVGNKKLRVPTKNRFLTIASFYFNTPIKHSTNISFEKSKNCVNLHFILVFSRAQLLRVSWRPGHRLNTRPCFA